jgi:hypothetical protein
MRTALFLILATLYISSCKKSGTGNNNNNGGGGGGGGNNGAQPTITSTSPQYTFWGDEMTINGTNFSTNKADNIVYFKGNKACSTDSTWQKAEVLSATATKLVVKVPYVTNPSGSTCGNDYSYIRVTVNNKSVKMDQAVKLLGFPELGSMCYHYGGFYHASTTRPGDSVVMGAGIRGLYAQESGYNNQLKLSVNGTQVNYILRSIGPTCGGIAFSLDPAIFADINNCTVLPGSLGEPCRKMTFTLSINGTNKSVSEEYFVRNHPAIVISQVIGNNNISISAGGNPYLDVKGKNMYFTDIKWSSTGELPITTAPPPGTFMSEMRLFIPLSLLLPGKTYAITGISQCNQQTTIGYITTMQ